MSPLCTIPDISFLMALFFADILNLCSFLTCHPLHFTYLLLFSPYLLILFSFLSPLLLSTSLFLILTLAIASDHSPQLPGNALPALLGVLKPRLDDEAGLMGLTPNYSPCHQIVQALLGDGFFVWDLETMTDLVFSMIPASCVFLENPTDHAPQNSLKATSLGCKAGDVSEALLGLDSGGEILKRSQSLMVHAQRDSELLLLQRNGSMRKGKEWKRTLACKLYEERITFKLCEDTKAGEEMDLLWEAYEDETFSKDEKKNKGKIDEVVGDDEDDDAVGQLCCLQAFRLSARKMNLGGVGTPNLVKVSNVLKGLGLFRSIRRRGSRKFDRGMTK